MKNDFDIEIGHQYSMTHTAAWSVRTDRGNDPAKSQIFTQLIHAQHLLNGKRSDKVLGATEACQNFKCQNPTQAV